SSRVCAHKDCAQAGDQAGVAEADSSAPSALTTPDAISLQRQLAQWRAQGVQRVTLEVSSHALVQGRVSGLHVDCAIFTNLSRDHLDYHGSMAAYAEAKSRLFAMPGLRSAVLNIDDPYAAQMRAALAPEVSCVGVSASANTDAEVRIALRHAQLESGRRAQLEGERLWLHTPWGEGEFHSQLIGAFNRANLAAVAAAALSLGVPFAQVLQCLPQLRAVAGRMQLVPNTLGLRVVVDFAHTPDALEQVLRTLRADTGGALHVVFGCGGDRDAGKRAPMGAVASALADQVYLSSDNPRGENPQRIIDQIAEGCTGAVWRHPDRAVAIATAIARAQPGDCVLIAGKGHERTQQIGARKLPFCDEQQAAAALRAREAQLPSAQRAAPGQLARGTASVSVDAGDASGRSA
ncbi:MAG: UDP-N-acetylmuramoyl-L-alanyl-D-glutamate--2,6-diaminopimelate ligase, partial [Lamprobacter sp.]|uniref:Mur ligase family protein n=1 Tax=Lamprobacter sp. TaxID=3100796 RepID=UPI002B25F2B6